MRPFLESLEERTTPAIHTWKGLAGNSDWSQAANWDAAGVPTGGLEGGAFADLVFPASAQRTTNNNNLTVGGGGLPTFRSITIAGSNYNLGGNAIALGDPNAAQSIALNVGAGAVNVQINFGVQLRGQTGSKQFFVVNAGADAALNEELTNPASAIPELTKSGAGTLILDHDNGQFQGPISLESNGGVVIIKDVEALGAVSAGTTVDTNATLRLEIPGGGTIAEPLILNGPGQASSGALLNFTGANTWSGSVQLDSNSTIGNDSAADPLTITGVISDLGAGHDLTKEGPGQIFFTANNTYRGLTTINDGILTIQHPHALGASGTSQSGTIVNHNPNDGTTGTLQIDDAFDPDPRPLDFDFVVFNEQLTLNGPGDGGNGALANVSGDNNWAGDVILGSPSPNGHPVNIGAAADTDLIISGIVSNPNGPFSVTKVDIGRLIFNNANTYTTATTVAAGILTIRDSLGLGASVSAGTTVFVDATLQLEVDFNSDLPGPIWDEGPDPRGRDLITDSITGTDGNGPQLGLTVTELLQISGLGFDDGSGRLGALHSKSGINVWQRDITLVGTVAAIGVEKDPFQSTDNNYYTHDYSLRIGLDPQTPIPSPPPPAVAPDIIGGNGTEFRKADEGHLILADTYSYTGITTIAQGWVTIETGQSPTSNNGPLGARRDGIADTAQPGTTVENGAALHLKPSSDSDLQLLENLTLTGPGVTHNFALISGKGALMSLGGNNVVGRGAINGVTVGSDIFLDGVAGIGVEFLPGPNPWKVVPAPAPAVASELTIVGSMYDGPNAAGGFDKFGSRRLVLQGDGSYTGANSIEEGIVLVQHDTALGHAGTGTSSGTQTFNISNTTVAIGAGLQFMRGIAENNGGIESGVNILDERMILNSSAVLIHTAGPGVGGTFTINYVNPATGTSSTTAALDYDLPGSGGALTTDSLENALNALPSIIEVGGVTVTKTGNVYRVVFLNTAAGADNAERMTAVGSGGAAIVTMIINNSASNATNARHPNAAVQNLSDDNMWRGPVTLNSDATINVAQNSRFTIFGPINNAAVAADLTVNSGVNTAIPSVPNIGELVLGGLNTYDGDTNIDAGLVTIMNGQALGTAVGGTVVADGATLQLQGAITVAGESLILQGTGLGTAPSNVPSRWFNVGPGPINNGQTPGNQASSGRITGIAVDPTDSDVIYISTAGGGAWKTENNGRTWMQIFDTLQTQTLYLNTNNVNERFTLTFDGVTTDDALFPLVYDSPTLAADIQAALNALPSIGGLRPQAGSVSVSQSTADPLLFKITFGGSLSARDVPQMTAASLFAGVDNPVVTSNTSVTYTGAIAVDPNDPRIIYLGTGEANNSNESYYGTGVYQSFDSGRTWNLLTNSDGSNPLYGLAVSKIVIDPGFPGRPYTPPQPNWRIDYDGNLDQVRNNPTGRIFVATSNATTMNPPVGVTRTPGVYRFDSSTQQLQTLTIPTTGAGQFTLTFGSGVGSTTAPLNFNSSALAIETAINNLATMVAAGGSVRVLATSNPHVFSIALLGDLLFVNNFPLPPGAGGPDPGPVPTPPPFLIANTVTGSAPDPIVTRSSSWVNLTSGMTPARQFSVGQGNRRANGPGPDDDFRRDFPENPNTAVWSDLSLTYIDIPVPRGTLNFIFRPVLYAALGNPAGNLNNAVYRTETPTLSPLGAGTRDTTFPTVWYVGAPQPPTAEVQQITWKIGTGADENLNHAFTLSFMGVPIPPPHMFPGGGTKPGPYTGIGSQNVTAAEIEAALNNLPTIGGVGGSVSVVETTGGSQTDRTFTITFGGTLGSTNVDEIVPSDPDNNWQVDISTLTQGAGIDDRVDGFPGGPFFGFPPRNGNIKLTTFTVPGTIIPRPIFPDQFYYPRLSHVTVYASITVPELPGFYPSNHGQLLEIQKSTAGGEGWAATSSPANYMGNNTSTSAALGWSASSIFASSPTVVFVGGEQADVNTHLGHLFMTTNGGGAWTDISAGPTAPPIGTEQGPHSAVHAMAVDISGTRRLIVGTDGGVWRLDDATANNVDWTDINGDLTVTQFNDVAVHPNDPNIALGGVQNNGVAQFNGSAAWVRTNVPSATPNRAGEGGQVAYDPSNPNTMYAVFILNGQGLPNQVGSVNSVLHKSTNGGATWTPTARTYTGPFTTPFFMPVLLDTVNTSRLLVGGNDLVESLDGGATFTTFGGTPFFFDDVTGIGAATFQGKFVADPGFTQVADKGTNIYDRDTIYVVADQNRLYLTKDHGQSWQNRTGPWGGGARVVDIAVDAGNRDVVYVTVRNFTGGAHVWRSVNAGQNWNNITGALPDLPVWKIVVDPRHDPDMTGNLYVGTDDGVFRLTNQSLAAATFNWQRFGSGMPNVQVRALELNQSLNMLTAGTYGRSMYQFILTDVPPVIQGNEVQEITIPLTPAPRTFQLDFTGEPTPLFTNDTVTAADIETQLNLLPSIGGIGGRVTVIQTNVGSTTELILRVTFLDALGSSNQPELIPIVFDVDFAVGVATLQDGFGIVPALPAVPADQPVYGALHAVSGSSFWTGPITLVRGIDTIVTASGSQALQNGISAAQLNIVGPIRDEAGLGTPSNLIKAGQGNVILSGENSYAGVTHVGEGVLIIQNKKALGTTAGNTIVHEGTMLELQSDLELEPILAYGHGIKFNEHFQGALFNSTNFNTYTGQLTLGESTGPTYPVFNPLSDTFNFRESVTIGVASGSQLSIGAKPGVLTGTGTVTDGALNLALIKELTGALVLASANTHGNDTTATTLKADTFVSQGALRVMHNEALGGSANGTTVLDGAQIQIESPAGGPSVEVADEHLWLSGTGIDGTGALLNTGGNNKWLAPLSLDDEPGLQPDHPAAGIIAIGVEDAGDTLIIAPPGGGIDELKRTTGETVPSGIDKVGAGTLAFTSANSYTGGVFVTAGILNVQHPNALAGTGVNDIQRVTVTGPSSSPGQFRLTFNGRTTGNLPFGATEVVVENALNGLLSMAGVGGSVNVTRLSQIVTPSDTRIWVYTVEFDGGSFVGVDQPMMSGLTTTASTEVFVSKVADGSFGTRVANGATLQLANLPAPMDVETVALNGAGAAGLGALYNAAGNNVWTGSVLLQTNSSIGALVSTALTVSGVVRDPYPVPFLAADLAKIGDGALIFPGANAYSGNTNVVQGVLNIRDRGALGRTTETQLVTLTPPSPSALPAGQFQLSFDGVNLSPLWNFDVSAATVESDLNALLTVNPIAGVASVSVTRTGNVFTVTFLTATPGTTSVPIGSQALLVPTPSGNFSVFVGSVVETQTVTMFGANGTFRLSFDGSAPTPPMNILTVTAAELQTNLNALSTISSRGQVFVRKTNNVFTVTFAGNLALDNQNELIVPVNGTTGGATILVATVSDGPEGTLVKTGATLQLQNIAGAVSTELLTLNGAGFGGQGALQNLSGDNTWSRIITLDDENAPNPIPTGNTVPVSIGVAGATDKLSIQTVIQDMGDADGILGDAKDVGVVKVGPGTLEYANDADNTYDGVTTVSQGVLLLNMDPNLANSPNSFTPFRGALTIGENASSDTDRTAEVRLARDHQIPATSFTQVFKDGFLNVGDFQEAINTVSVLDGHVDVDQGFLQITNLTIVDGNVTTTADGDVAVTNLNMTGGTITLTDAASQLVLNGNVTATSSTVPALIQGAGTVQLNGANRTFTVNPGGDPVDLRIANTIVSSGGEILIKDGDGLMEFAVSGQYAGTTRLDDGTLQVDGVIGPVVLDGTGVLAGLGTVGNVTTADGGTVSPGHSPGVLNVVGDVAWNGDVTYLVDLVDDTAAPGTGFDVLNVSGAINLNGAQFNGVVDPAVDIDDSFTVITADTVDGQFAQGLFAFINGQKFGVTYNLNPVGQDTVVITRIRNTSFVDVVSSANPSVWGQDVTFTATVSPEQGTGPIPNNSPVEFRLEGPNIPAGSPIVYATVVTNNKATFNPFSNAGNFILEIAPIAPIDNRYTLTINFLETDDFLASANTLRQEVRKASTAIDITSSLNPASFGDTITVTADVDILSPGGALAGTNDLTGGTVTFFVNGAPQSPAVPVNSAGGASMDLVGLGVGNHAIRASYSGDNHRNGSLTITDLTQQVNKADTDITVSAVPTPFSDPGQNVTFTVTVTSSAGTPTGEVVIDDGIASFGRKNLAGGSATFDIATLPSGVYTINVYYLGSSNFNTSTNSMTHVVRSVTTMDVTANLNPSIVGDTVRFTATVTKLPGGPGSPTGTVNFYDGPAIPANLIGSGALLSGQATLDIASLTFGVHTINATYSGDNFYLPNADSLSQNVKGRTTLDANASPNPSTVGQQVTLTAQVNPISPATGVATGNVEFSESGTVFATAALDGSGFATVNVSNLSFGVHNIHASFAGDTRFVASADDIVQVVKGNTTTTVTSSLNPSHYGETLTFTATVKAVAPATGTPTGSVQFFVDGTSLNAPETLDANGKASTSTASLNAGPHVITAVYAGDGLYNGGAGTLAPDQFIEKTATATTVSSSTTNPTAFGQPVDFRIEVNAVAPGGGIVTGTVDLFDGASLIAVNLPIPSQPAPPIINFSYAGLSVGTHPNITARYNGNGNFLTSGSSAVSRTVNKADTSTLLATTQTTSVYGQATLTATVSAIPPGGLTPNSGTATFFITNLTTSAQTQTTVGVNSSGVATLNPTLNAGNYSIRARYNGNGSYNASGFSNTLNPVTVNQADSTTSVTSSDSSSIYGEATITAEVDAVFPGAGTPTGQVIFVVSGPAPSANSYPVTLDSAGKAVLPRVLDVGTYTITVNYQGDNNFKVSSGSLADPQVVSQADSTVGVVSNHNPSVTGQMVTFTATVSAVSPGFGVVPGTVDFFIDGILVGDNVTLTDGKATHQTNTLSVSGSPHTVHVDYNGSLNFDLSSGDLAPPQVVNKGDVTGSLAANPSAALGATVTFNATFTPVGPAAGSPGGTADLFIDGVERQSNVPVSGGAVSFDFTNPAILTQGNHNVFVHFDGDASFNQVNSNTVVQNIKGDVTVGVASNNNPSDFGESVTFTVTVAPDGSASGTPGGTVDFQIDGNVVASNVQLDGNGQAIYQTTSIHAGGSPHTVSVHYDGDTFFFQGDGDLVQNVNKVNTSVAVSSNANASVFGQPVTFTANISRQIPGVGAPDGTANLIIDGVTRQSNVNVVNGVATFAAISNLSVSGSPHSIQVSYLGSGDFNASSNTLAGGQNVNQAVTTTSVSSAPNPSVFQQNVTFIANVSVQVPSVATPTGFVRFFIDGVAQLPDQALSSGQASLTTNSLTLGIHTVSAQFLGTSDLAGSTGNLPNQQVNPNPVVFAVVPGSVKSGMPFTVVVQYRNGGNPDPNFNGPVSLGITSGPSGGFIVGNTTVNASGGVATFNLILPKAGAYNLLASANGLPAVISPTIQSTALGLAVALAPARIFTNQLFVINANAFDATGGVATNYNGGFSVTIVKKPTGARIRGARFGAFTNGSAQLFLKVNKAGTYLLRLNGPDGLTSTIRLVIRGRRSSSR